MIDRAILLVVGAGLVILPMTVVPGGADRFRLPKELLFRGEAIVLFALMLLRARNLRLPVRLSEWRREHLLAAAIVVWSIIVTATSTHRALSIDSLITILAAAVIFLATCIAAESLSHRAVDLLMPACCVNAVITILQENGIWSPIPVTEGHYGAVGLMGNANDVGTFLAAPAVAAVVMAVTFTGKRRWLYLAIANLLVAGMIASATRTALIAFVAAMIVLAIVQARRAAVVIAVVLVVVGLAVMSPATTLGRSARELGRAAVDRNYQLLFSERLLPFLAAVEMTRDHPVAGVGPGCFRFHYMSYRVALEEKYPPEWTRGYPMNWGAVHNDYLQVAAETGVIGLLLFLAAIAILVARRGPPQEATFAGTLRWPLATVIFVVCLAQFPLELAAPRLMFITLGAVCLTVPNIQKRQLRLPHSKLVIVGIILIVASAFAIYHLCVIPFRDNITLREIEERLSVAQSLDPGRAASLARKNLDELRGIEQSQKLSPVWYTLYGANCEMLELWQEAADIYTRALVIDQRPELYLYRGLAMLHLGDIEHARADMITAVRFNPIILDQITGELRTSVAAAAGVQ
ncbi:MAG TPA: O-antigen ligase family protein [Thermoanaerobaculia bacterium]|jgi:O-antigen ligase|nr:O-antigen ligase family protein [Thermoanaerobaculia bacterium]